MTGSDISLPAQADLRFLLNLTKGQSVALVNLGKFLQTALINDGVEVTIHTGKMSTLQGSYDAVLFASTSTEAPNDALKACSEKIKSNGQSLFCFPNRNYLKRLIDFRNRKNESAISLSEIRSSAKNAGFRVLASYGIYENVNEPRFFIPLDNPQAIKFFFDHMLTPYTTFAKILTRLAPTLVNLGLSFCLFNDICVVVDYQC